MATLLGIAPPPAHAAIRWVSGSAQYSYITYCLDPTMGEYGIAALTSYRGDPDASPKIPAVGEATYMSVYIKLLGAHCSTPYVFPRFALPAGVQFDTSYAIRCFQTPPGDNPVQSEVAAGHNNCPQWNHVSANGTYTSGWNDGGWTLPSDENFNNNSAWEFLVPIKATTQQSGSQLIAFIQTADGNDNPTLTPSVSFWTGPPAVSAPGAPTNVSASASSSTTANVTFSPPTSNGGSAVTGYSVECTSSSGGTSRTAAGATSPITVSALSPGHSYSCRVRATNSVGAGPWSNPSAGFSTPPSVTPPGSPTTVTTTVLSARSVRVAFAPPASNGGSAITSYRAQCLSTDGGTTRAVDGTASPITLTTLSPSKAYRCRVRATNAVGAGPYSALSSVVRLPAAPPDRPTDVKLKLAGSTWASVTFTAPADNGSPITSYRVQCMSSDGGTTRAGDGTSSPIAANGLTPGKAYRCRVRATNAIGDGIYSVFSTTFRTPG